MPTLWYLAYAVQIAFGMYVLFTCPKRPDLPGRVQNARGYAIWAGFIPFVLIMLVVQLACFGWYKASIARAASVRASLQTSLPTSFGASAAPNPSLGMSPPRSSATVAPPAVGPQRSNPFL
jgi:hypothetical protein